MSEWTPGKWRYENGKILASIPTEERDRKLIRRGRLIVGVLSLGWKGSNEMHANGELLAASKEMYAALSKIRRSDFVESEQPLWDEIQAALAKARGE